MSDLASLQGLVSQGVLLGLSGEVAGHSVKKRLLVESELSTLSQEEMDHLEHLKSEKRTSKVIRLQNDEINNCLWEIKRAQRQIGTGNRRVGLVLKSL